MLFVWDWDFYCYGDDAGVDGDDIDGVDIDGDGAGDVVGGGDVYGGDVSGDEVDGDNFGGVDVNGGDVDSGDVGDGDVDGGVVGDDDVDGGDVDGGDVDGGDVSGDEVGGDNFGRKWKWRWQPIATMWSPDYEARRAVPSVVTPVSSMEMEWAQMPSHYPDTDKWATPRNKARITRQNKQSENKIMTHKRNQRCNERNNNKKSNTSLIKIWWKHTSTKEK